MRINFETSGNYINLNAAEKNNDSSNPVTKEMNGICCAFSSKKEANSSFRTYSKAGESLEDIQKKAGSQNLDASFDFMTLMSNTTSGKDYAKMWEEGFDVSEYSPEEAVTIIDRIKSAMMEGGAYIPGYTDTISDETLKNLAGDQGVFMALKDNFLKNEVNLTENTVKDVSTLIDEAEKLTEIDSSTVMYMIANNMEPSIHNMYLAMYSVSTVGDSNVNSLTDMAKLDEILNSLQPEINKMQKEAGIEDSKEALEIARELLSNGLPVTEETLHKVKEIKDIVLPLSKDTVINLAAVAVAEGKNVKDANPLVTETSWDKAQKLFFEIKDKRILEETRLIMTIDANKKLIESNVAVDTSNLEDLVDKLKQAEEEIAKSLFADRPEDAVELLHQYESANDAFTKIRSIPLDTIPGISADLSNLTPEEIVEAGEITRAKLTQANEQYETLMTKPRYDLGDRIGKAFQNAEAILNDMGLEASEDNLRAIRALGYNSMEITQESIEEIKLADISLRNIVSEMKPGKVLGMIRDNINPLEVSMKEIEEYLESKDSSPEEEQKKYSEYLYALEKNKEISEDEKQSYIGIFRLIRQIEKSDGAILGSLINQGAEINFDNLLHAYRSKKYNSRDVKIGDDDKISVRTNKENSIDDQINSAYIKQRLKALEIQMDEKVAQLEREAVQSGEDSYGKYLKEVFVSEAESMPISQSQLTEVLQVLDTGATIGNLQAISDFWKNSSKLYERIRELNTKDNQEALEDEARQLFSEETDEQPAVRYEDFINIAKEKINSTLNTKDNLSLLDTRMAGLIYKQLGFCISQVKQNSYNIPVKIGDEISNVHLTLKNSENDKGAIDISMDTQVIGKMSLNLLVKGEKISGSMVYERKNSSDIIDEISSQVENAMLEKGYSCQGIYAGWNKSYATAPVNTNNSEISETSSKELFGIAMKALTAISNALEK